jgi:hypothetical protein
VQATGVNELEAAQIEDQALLRSRDLIELLLENVQRCEIELADQRQVRAAIRKLMALDVERSAWR